MQYLGATSKMKELFWFPRQAIQHHSNPSLWPYHRCWRSWGWSVLWRHRRPPKTNIRNRYSTYHWGLECEVGSQEIPEVTGKFGLREQNATGQRLTEFCQENALVIANTLFNHTRDDLHMDITIWPISKSNWLHSLYLKMEKLYTVSKNKTWSWLWLRSPASHSKIHS